MRQTLILTEQQCNELLVQTYQNLKAMADSPIYGVMIEYWESVKSVGPQIFSNEWPSYQVAIQQDLEVLRFFYKFHIEAQELLKKFNPNH